MKKVLAAISFVLAAVYYVRYGSTIPPVLIQTVDMFFRWISIENPAVMYFLGAFAIAFGLLFWRSRRNVTIIEEY